MNLFALTAYAQTTADQNIDTFLAKIMLNIVNPAIEFAFIIALVVFLWGAYEFIRGANEEKARKLGKDHMLYGFVGFLIMFGVYGIITLLAHTFGIDGVVVNDKDQKFTPPCIQEVKIGNEKQGSILPCKN